MTCHLFTGKAKLKRHFIVREPLTLPPTLSLSPPPLSSTNSPQRPPGSLYACLQGSLQIPYLDGLHRVILVQFVDVVSYAGVERGGSDRMDDCSIVGLLLVPLAVGIDEQREKTAQDGAAQPHSDHMEHVELWGESIISELCWLRKRMLTKSHMHSNDKRKRQCSAKPCTHSKIQELPGTSFEMSGPPRCFSTVSTVYLKLVLLWVTVSLSESTLAP